jgi:hypothetical protein
MIGAGAALVRVSPPADCGRLGAGALIGDACTELGAIPWRRRW